MDSINKFIKSYFKKANRQVAILGVSGGLDSSITLVLCAKALGPASVFPIYLPYQPMINPQNIRNIKKVIKLAKIPKKNLIIESITGQINSFKKKHPDIDPVDLGNKTARERMSLLYFYARKLKGLVVGTGNKSEMLLGYFTLHGDGAWDLAPIAHLYKTETRQLAKKLSIPAEIISQPPTAGFWSGQTDEKELGFTYKQADKVLRQFIDQKVPPSKIKHAGISTKIIKRILNRYQTNRFKL